jgi:hypothetical protein
LLEKRLVASTIVMSVLLVYVWQWFGRRERAGSSEAVRGENEGGSEMT